MERSFSARAPARPAELLHHPVPPQTCPQFPDFIKRRGPPPGPRARYSQSARSPRAQQMARSTEIMPFSRRSPREPREPRRALRFSRCYSTESRKQTACPIFVRPFIVDFDALSDLFHSFVKNSPPDFMNTKVTDLHKGLQGFCDVFVQQASVHFSGVSPQTDQRATMKFTPMHKAAKQFVYQWASFIEVVNEMESEGLAPYVGRINTSFDEIFDAIYVVRSAMPVIRFRTDIACVALEKLQNGVVALRDEISGMLLATKEERFKGFVAVAFKKRVTLLMHSVSDLYDKALPHSCLPVARTLTTRSTMSAAIAAIATAVNMARQADHLYALLKEKIFEVNEKLTKVCEQLNFPFSVSLMYDDEQPQNQEQMARQDSLHIVNLEI